MTDIKNAIVIGAGHNGLTCAAYLAKAGFKVMVFEAAEHVGGAADTREFEPGFSVSGCAHFTYHLRPEILSDLELRRHGLEFAATGLATTALSESGEHVSIKRDRLIGAVSERDQSGHAEFSRLTRRFAKLLAPYLDKAPPLLTHNSGRDRLTLARLGLDIRRLGSDDMREFLRIIAINIYDVLNEFYADDLVKGAISLDAVLGSHLGPRSPNSVLTYLYRLAGGSGLATGDISQPAGGMGSVTAAMARAAKTAGVEIRTGAPVEKILVEDGRTTGVCLAGGEIVRSLTVVSSADPKTTMLSLVGPRHCETGFVRRISNLRANGNAAKLHLALDGTPEFRGLDRANLGQRLLIAPNMEYVERAFNPAKYGEYSAEPVLEIGIPTVNDDSLAPAGKHVLSATVQYAPYRLKAGWDATTKQVFHDRAIATIERYAPRIREQIIASELLTPADIEARYRMHGGHWHHAELTLDQFLFVRPVPGAAQYAMPVTGLYLCGAGAHPGGGITGSPGRNAAKVIAAGGHSE